MKRILIYFVTILSSHLIYSQDNTIVIVKSNTSEKSTTETHLLNFDSESTQRDSRNFHEILEKSSKSELIAVGNALPNIELLSINGNSINLNDLKGKYILINFWATWCEGCIKNMPYFEKLIETHKSDNIVFVYISVDKSKERWEKFVNKEQLSGIQLFAKGTETKPVSYFLTSFRYDENGEIAGALSLVPAYALIDPNGIILENNLEKGTKEEMSGILDKLL